jgi:hypothetical protein
MDGFVEQLHPREVVCDSTIIDKVNEIEQLESNLRDNYPTLTDSVSRVTTITKE